MPRLIITCHSDSVFSQNSLTFAGSRLIGTLDNLVGIVSICQFLPLISKYHIPLHFTQFEEVDQVDSKALAAYYDPLITRVLNIDCDEVDDPSVICQLDNIQGYSSKEIDEMKECILYWFEDDLKIPSNYYKDVYGNEDFKDDAWSFASKGYKVLTLTYPVTNKFHTDKCSITVKQLENYQRALKAILYYLLDENL